MSARRVTETRGSLPCRPSHQGLVPHVLPVAHYRHNGSVPVVRQRRRPQDDGAPAAFQTQQNNSSLQRHTNFSVCLHLLQSKRGLGWLPCFLLLFFMLLFFKDSFFDKRALLIVCFQLLIHGWLTRYSWTCADIIFELDDPEDYTVRSLETC